MNKQKIFKNFLWLVYPAAVLLFVAITGNILMGESPVGWAGLMNKRFKIESDSQRSVRLTQKINYLKSVSTSVVEEDLRTLTEAVPISKPVLQVVASMKWAAALSGATVESYRSVTIGEIKEASVAAVESERNLVRQETTLTVSSIDQLVQFLENLEKLLPLSNVAGVSYTNGTVAVTVIPSWSPLVRAAAEIDKPITDFGVKLSGVKKKLEQYSLSPGL